MPTEILAIGTTEADSNDVVVAPGADLTVCLKSDVGPITDTNAHVDIRLKDDAGRYFTVADLSGSKPALVIAGAGTYRFSRYSGSACGVFSG